LKCKKKFNIMLRKSPKTTLTNTNHSKSRNQVHCLLSLRPLKSGMNHKILSSLPLCLFLRLDE
jgi:hypothetical protein